MSRTLVTRPANIRYLAGWAPPGAVLLIAPGDEVLVHPRPAAGWPGGGRPPRDLRRVVLDTTDGDPAVAAADPAPGLGTESLAVLHRQAKTGLGDAYLAGFRAALEAGAERIFEMDADFSHPVPAVPAMLALAESNRSARLSSLRELWSDQGRIESLLRRPFAGQPASLLLGDEYFLPELGRAMTAMNEDFQPTRRRIDLTVTTTLLRGVPEKTIDALGQVIPDEVHSGRLRFRSGADVVLVGLELTVGRHRPVGQAPRPGPGRLPRRSDCDTLELLRGHDREPEHRERDPPDRLRLGCAAGQQDPADRPGLLLQHG